MTVTECVKTWLGSYDGVDLDVDIGFLEGDNDTYAIYKQPNRNEVAYNDGSKLVTDYFQFFARQSTQIPENRIENEQFLDDLENWVEEENFNEEYPDLSPAGNLECQDIGITSTAAIISQEDDSAIYQLILAVQYLKER